MFIVILAVLVEIIECYYTSIQIKHGNFEMNG